RPPRDCELDFRWRRRRWSRMTMPGALRDTSGGPVDRVGEPDHRTIGQLLLDRAEATPDRMFLQFEDGDSWTWAECGREALRTCTALRRLGVEPGDRVGIFLPNGQDWFRA